MNRSVEAYFDLDESSPNSVILENYSLDDDEGEQFDVIAKYFYLPGQFDPEKDKRFEVLTEDDLGT